MTLTPDDPRHGSTNGYTNHACRCERCRAAASAAWHAWHVANPQKHGANHLTESEMVASHEHGSRLSMLDRDTAHLIATRGYVTAWAIGADSEPDAEDVTNRRLLRGPARREAKRREIQRRLAQEGIET